MWSAKSSFGFDFHQFKAAVLILLSFVLCIKNKDLVPWQTHSLLLRHLENQGEELVATVTQVRRNLIASDSPGHVYLAGDRGWGRASEDGLVGAVLSNIASDAAGVRQANEHVDVVIKCDAAGCGGKGIGWAQFLSIIYWIGSHIIVNLFIIKDVLTLSNTFSQLHSGVNGILSNWCFVWENEGIDTLENTRGNILSILTVSWCISDHGL